MDYSLLKDLRLEISDEEGGGFSFSLWLYLPKPTHYPAILISQVHPNIMGVVPFLVLNTSEKIELRQFLFSRKETLDPANSAPQKRFTSTSSDIEFPLDEWVHVGCEISTNMARLYINGHIKEDLIFFSNVTNLYNSNDLKRATMIGTDNKAIGVPGYVHNAKLLPLKFSMKELYVEDPPLQLSIDMSSASNIVLCSPGVCIVVDDKVPNNYFSLDVILSNALGQLVNMDIEVYASYMYINEPVESLDDTKAPVTSKMLQGRASFRLKIPKILSKRKSRSFRIKFDILKIASYPFFSLLSLPIWSVSDKRHLTSATPLLDGSHMSELEDVYSDVQHECERTNSQAETTELLLKSMSISKDQTYHSTAVKYGLNNTNERALLLKDFAPAVSDQDLAEFANQVFLLSGCIHNRNQILIAKKLIEDGAKAWNRISGDNDYAVWDHALFFIHAEFANIASSHFRSLSQKDYEILKLVAGCDGQYFMSRENFERLWYWLYPVAVTLSSGRVNAMWGSTSPKLIEGFVTKEEAEFSLQSSDNQEPGTFILRFPTTTSWPHPDAGSLFVTYIGSDNCIRHKLLFRDSICSSGATGTNEELLQYMLLAEPELSRLGTIQRHN